MKYSNRELGYVVARISLGMWLLLLSWPRLLMIFSATPGDRIVYLGSSQLVDSLAVVLLAVFAFIILLGGVGLMLGANTRRAAAIGVFGTLVTASPGYALLMIGLIVFNEYNRFCIDRSKEASVS